MIDILNTELTRSKSPASIGGGCQRADKSSMDSTKIQRESNLPLNEVSFNVNIPRQPLEQDFIQR